MGRLNKKDIKSALYESNGVITQAAEILGCSRMSLYRRLERHDDLKVVREEAEEKGLDIAESKLNSAVEKGEAWAVKWKLATKGKKRGYTEKYDIGLDGPLEINVTMTDD